MVYTLEEYDLYGSSRIGTKTGDDRNAIDFNYAYVSDKQGERSYELTDHLGNVSTVISDRKVPRDLATDGTVDYYVADVLNANSYYAFGSLMPGRKYSAREKYNYGFNGKLNDNEISGEGNNLDFGARIYESRLGRWMSVDPYFKEYVPLSPFHFSFNCPFAFKDNDGNVIIDKNGNVVTVSISQASDGTCEANYAFAEGTSQKVIDDFMINGANVIDELLKITTGTELVQRAITTEEKIHIVVDPTSKVSTETDADNNIKTSIVEGETSVKTMYTNLDENGKLTSKSEIKTHYTEVRIYEGSIKETQRVLKTNRIALLRGSLKLTLFQMIATTAVHELEHATNKLEQEKRMKGQDGADKNRHKEIREVEEKAINEYGESNEKKSE